MKCVEELIQKECEYIEKIMENDKNPTEYSANEVVELTKSIAVLLTANASSIF